MNQRIVKVLLVVLACMTSLGAYSQKNQNVTIQVQNSTIKNVLEKIEKQTTYVFSNRDDFLANQEKVSIDLKNVPVSKVLDTAFAGTNLSYSIVSPTSILIMKRGSSVTSASQDISITGTVVDSQGEPLTGATISINNSHKATVADIDGKFSIPGKPGQTLTVRLVGMTPVKVKIKNGQTEYPIVMNGDEHTLDQVVVVGYGTMQKKRVTSSITSVSGEDLMSGVGGATIATALQGKVSGLTINGNSSPNSSNGYQLRGVSSVTGSTAPLVVIDGVPGGDLRAINQEDVESIDVLKDASAGAIYGTRASAGVILVTTKKAKEGKATVTYNGDFSIESVRKRLDMLSPEEYLAYGRGENFGSRTDWYDLMCRDTPFSQRHSVTMNGGTKVLSLYSSLSYSNQQGIVIGDGRQDYSARLNGRYVLWENKLEVGLRMQYREAHRDQRNTANDVENSIALNPTIPVMDPDNPTHYNVNKAGLGADFFNPVANIMDQDYKGVDQWVMGDFNLKYTILPGFTAQGSIGIDRRQWTRTIYYNQFHRKSIDSGKLGEATHSYQKSLNTNWEAYLSYTKEFGDVHHFDAMAGWSYFNETGQESFSMTNRDFTVDGIGPWDMSAGKDLNLGLADMASGKEPSEHLLSWYGRANYSYDDKYIAMVSYRREGSSKFGKNNRWGNFWSVSGGWRMNRESWLRDVEWLDELKLRAGYGVTGNDNFAAGYTTYTYTSDGMYPTPGGLAWGSAYKSARNANPDLKWEEKKEFNIGLDFGFFNNRLSGKFDWFSRRVDDMLFAVTAPAPPMTAKTIMKNIGSLSNKGWEFELTGRIFETKDFNWNATARFSHSSSKIKNLGEESSQILSDGLPQSMGNTHKLVNNQTIGQFWLFKNAGVDENGEWLIYDKDGNIVPAKGNDKIDNKYYLGNGIPKLVFSMDHNFRYRDFDLGINCRSYIDYDVYDTVNLYYGLQKQQGVNVLRSAYEENDHIKGNRITCDYFLSDASFFKIDAISLGYTLNLSKWQKKIKSLRVYVTARDVATFTKYKGYNPEQNINGLFPGVEEVRNKSSMYPQTIHWNFGLQLKF